MPNHLFIKVFLLFSIPNLILAQVPSESKNNSSVITTGIIDKEAKETPAQYYSALQLYWEGKYDASLGKIREVFDLHQNNYDLRLLAASNYLRLENYRSAKLHIRKVITMYPKKEAGIALYVRILCAQGKCYQAKNIATRAIQNMGETPLLHLSVAGAYYNMRSWRRTHQQLQQLLKMEPHNFYGYYLDGLTFLKEKRYEAAEFRLRNALAIGSQYPKDMYHLYHNLSFALEKKARNLERQNKSVEAKYNYKQSELYNNYALELKSTIKN